MRLALLYRRRWALFYLPLLAAAAVLIGLAMTYGMPLPHRTLTMAAGVADGDYRVFAQRYRAFLQRHGIELRVVAPQNGQDTLAALMAPGRGVDVAFAQGVEQRSGAIAALAVVGREPVWVFSRTAGTTQLSQLSQLRGLRVGMDGSAATPGVLRTLLAHARLQPGDIQLASSATGSAANDLIDGKIDVLVTVSGEFSPTVRQLSRADGVQLVGMDRPASLAAREPLLRPFPMAQGAIELRGDVPARDIAMVATQTHLLVRDSMHPALQRLLIDASRDIHELPSLLRRQGEFPTTRDADFPLSPVARDYELGDRPWLETLLPYHTAQVAELLLYVALPVFALTLLLLAWIPRLFAWRVNAVLQNYYGALKFLEDDIDSTASDRPLELRKLLQRLDDMERELTRLELPDRFADRWYTLRQHLAMARTRLLDVRSR